MKITIDILDEEYMPECPYCQKRVEINNVYAEDVKSFKNVAVFCSNCFYFFDVELIVRQAIALKKV